MGVKKTLLVVGLVISAIVLVTISRPPESTAQDRPSLSASSDRTLVVASATSVNALASKLKYILDVGEAGNAVGAIDATIAKLPFIMGGDWLDRDSPFGLVMQQGGDRPPLPLVFLPLKAGRSIYPANGLINPSKAGRDIYEHTATGVPIYLKVHGSWVFASNDSMALNESLPNIHSLIAAKPRSADVWVSLRIAELPDIIKQGLLSRLHTIVEDQGVYQPGDMPGSLDSRLLGAQIGTLPYRWMIQDGERVDIALKVGSPRRGFVIDADFIARPGSELSKLFSQVNLVTSRFSTLNRPNSLANVSFAWPNTPASRRLLTMLMGEARSSLENAISHANSVSPSEEDTKLARQMFHPLLNILEEGLTGETIEFYFGFWDHHRSGYKTLNLAVGMKNARKLEAWFNKHVHTLQAVGAFEKVSLNLSKSGTTTIHQVWTNLPEDEEAEIFGSRKPPMAFGFGRDVFLVSLGADCVQAVRGMASSLKSVGASPAGRNPIHVDLSFRRWMETFAPDRARPTDYLFLKAMAKDDRFIIDVTPASRGVSIRYAFEEGFVRFLGAAIGEKLKEKLQPPAGL